jgi:hypothetical protein
MKQADSRIETLLKRHRCLRQILADAVLADLLLEAQLQLAQRTRADLSDIINLFMRSRHISALASNVNPCSSLRIFPLTMPEIGVLVPFLVINGMPRKEAGTSAML